MKGIYSGLFITALATLMYEILLTRIFSVTMWYHYAFMAISIALFGMTLGAVIVYLFPGFFSVEKTHRRLGEFALIFSIAIPISFIIYLSIPFAPADDLGIFIGLISLASIYITVAIPFIFSGIVVSLALTKYSLRINKLYAVDLIGAAIGCILLIVVLNIFTGPTAVILIAAITALASITFLIGEKTKLKIVGFIFFLVCIIFVAVNTYFVNKQQPLLTLRYVKGGIESGALYEKWNSFSRITVYGNEGEKTRPFGWGLSEVYPRENTVNQLWLLIDATAGTPLTKFTGNLDEIEFLKYDIVNVAHHLRKDADVMVVGVGGGRDVLSAFAFKQKSVTGLEVNDAIVGATLKRYGDFTGHIDSYPGVKIVNDEARSYIARSKETFDILQISLIDTWAATAAGAFVLTENSLYTVEAWKTFLEHLNPNGILTVSRWYFKDRPGEVYRLASLAAASLREIGVTDPRQHIAIARRLGEDDGRETPDGVGTILVSRSPFTKEDLANLKAITADLHFEEVLTPDFTIDPVFEKAITEAPDSEFYRNFSLNITPPTDDNPFFFHMLRLKDVLSGKDLQLGKTTFNLKAVAILLEILVITILLAFLFIILPLFFKARRSDFRGSLSLILYFMSIGMGFIIVEIAFLQRLIIYLGHPIYSLSVILFSLLLGGGIGSHLSQKIIKKEKWVTNSYLILIPVVVLVLIGGLITPYVITVFSAVALPVRIVFSLLAIGLMGISMGICFPLGVFYASRRHEPLLPFLWGVNGALSVVASVLSVVIAITSGISITFWVGILCYVIAFISLFVFSRKSQV